MVTQSTVYDSGCEPMYKARFELIVLWVIFLFFLWILWTNSYAILKSAVVDSTRVQLVLHKAYRKLEHCLMQIDTKLPQHP